MRLLHLLTKLPTLSLGWMVGNSSTGKVDAPSGPEWAAEFDIFGRMVIGSFTIRKFYNIDFSFDIHNCCSVVCIRLANMLKLK